MWIVFIVLTAVIFTAYYYVKMKRKRTLEKAKLYDRAYYTVARFSSRNPRKKRSL